MECAIWKCVRFRFSRSIIVPICVEIFNRNLKATWFFLLFFKDEISVLRTGKESIILAQILCNQSPTRKDF